MTGVLDEREGVPCADVLELQPGVTPAVATGELLAQLPGWYAATTDEALAANLLAAGAVLFRHAHQMRRDVTPAAAVPCASPSDDVVGLESFASDATPPRPWAAALPDFLAAYPPEHPDYIAGGEALIESYLIPFTAGARLGPLITGASCLAVDGERVPGGLIVVDRPDEGPWVSDIWRAGDPKFAGLGAAMLTWSMAQLAAGGYSHLGLAVTVSNVRAHRAYERLGFETVATSWTLRLPASQ